MKPARKDNYVNFLNEVINKIVCCTLDFPIQVLSIDTLVQEAIKAFHDNEQVSEALPIEKKDEEKALPVQQETSKESQASVILVFFSAPHILMESKRSSRPEVNNVFYKGPERKYFRFCGPRGKINVIVWVFI